MNRQYSLLIHLGKRSWAMKSQILTGLFMFFLVMCHNMARSQHTSPQEYIELYKEWAIEEMARSGIPASIKLAQGMLESNNGNSTLTGKAKGCGKMMTKKTNVSGNTNQSGIPI